MTEKQRQAKLAKLKDKLTSLEDKLFAAKCEENEKNKPHGLGIWNATRKNRLFHP